MTVTPAWTPDDRPAVRYKFDKGNRASLLDRYSDGTSSVQLERIFNVVAERGASHLLVEQRYIDQDWRSEHTAYYAKAFRQYPSVTHRMHFFTAEPPEDLIDLRPLNGHYLGYTVLRPLPTAPVGRTMIVHPPELDDAVRCESTEHLDILGWPFAVTASPFVSQDAAYLRCAHAAMWMALRNAHHRHGLPLQLPADIHDAATGGVIVGRETPSEGLSVQQILAGLTRLGLSPELIKVPETRLVENNEPILGLYSVMARYINSNLPPIVVSKDHAWVPIGYTRNKSGGNDQMTLYRHDDARGPYMRVEDPWAEPDKIHRPWRNIVLPLPAKYFMTAERAENIGRWWFGAQIEKQERGTTTLLGTAKDRLAYTTYGIRSRDFKQSLIRRPDMPAPLTNLYRRAALPRHIWVVEVIDSHLREQGLPAVLGEVLIDPTGSRDPTEQHPCLLAAHAGAKTLVFAPEHSGEFAPDGEVPEAPYTSGLHAL
jgi:hypothetical protein